MQSSEHECDISGSIKHAPHETDSEHNTASKKNAHKTKLNKSQRKKQRYENKRSY